MLGLLHGGFMLGLLSVGFRLLGGGGSGGAADFNSVVVGGLRLVLRRLCLDLYWGSVVLNAGNGRYGGAHSVGCSSWGISAEWERALADMRER